MNTKPFDPTKYLTAEEIEQVRAEVAREQMPGG